jgi:hypothetical protein
MWTSLITTDDLRQMVLEHVRKVESKAKREYVAPQKRGGRGGNGPKRKKHQNDKKNKKPATTAP